ncbi:DMT family transporter [Arenicella xantha]|uniref:EamA-like transporter family protein n=1 Tax=Arenicella xantha TaxID=644221 RepID=A0A395JGE3_9GAMM|nr:EamA family transporter [Arenicella xantha]RBP48926.1 EamA-like transporter family protein [Arenicella xantha]
MKNATLYVLTVLIWGSTWLAIEFQLGSVHVLASVAYRFAIAAILMWLFCLWRRIPMRFSLRNHGYIVLLALFNFSLNYAVIYTSQKYLTSAMTSVAFSTMLLMNIINTRIFFGSRISPRVFIGSGLGILGIYTLFRDDLFAANESGTSLVGLGLVLLAALIASIGNMVSVRNSRAGMNVFAVNAWGMLYGTIALCVIMLLTGTEFGFELTTNYLASLIYLSVFGTVIAFATYYVLLSNMGPERASYVIVLFPVVAIVLSSLFENFAWTHNTFVGFALVMLGNAVVLTPFDRLRRLTRISTS